MRTVVDDLLDDVAIVADCRVCGNRGRYCRCPDGPTVLLADVAPTLEAAAERWGGACMFCPIDAL